MSSAVYSVNLFAQLLISVFIFSQILKPKKNIWLIFFVLFIPYDICHLMFNSFAAFVPESVQSLVYFLIVLGIIFSMFEGKKIKKIGLFFSYLLYQILTELLSMFAVCMLFGVSTSDFYEYGDKNIYVSAARVMYVDLMLISALMVLFIIKSRHMNSRKIISDFGMMGGFAGVHFIFLCLYYKFNISNLLEINNIIQIIFQTLLIVMIFVQYDNSVKIRKYAEYEKELLSLKNEMDSTYNYYILADEKFREISEIRHDIRNQIKTAKNLILSQNKPENAEKILDDLQNNLEGIKAVNYCDNPTVNAVLTVKLNDNRYNCINTDIILKEMSSLPFSDYELCSIISNLFDNAAEECLRCSDDTEKFIKIRSDIKGENFIISFTNSISENKFGTQSRKTDSGHGHGLKIIEKICKNNKAEFSLTQKGDEVEAAVIVPVTC